jgi:hypothetical protein
MGPLADPSVSDDRSGIWGSCPGALTGEFQVHTYSLTVLRFHITLGCSPMISLPTVEMPLESYDLELFSFIYSAFALRDTLRVQR